jgi:hypothetical protein
VGIGCAITLIPLVAAVAQWPGAEQSDPSGILHIVGFVTLYEADMTIDPNFDLWNYFFCVRRPQDLDMEMTILRGVVIHT